MMRFSDREKAFQRDPHDVRSELWFYVEARSVTIVKQVSRHQVSTVTLPNNTLVKALDKAGILREMGYVKRAEGNQ